MRHAVFFTPDSHSDLARLGSSWLGRDVVSCAPVEQPDPRLWEITAHARHYGFHGTLKPPFLLKDGTSTDNFVAAVGKLATRCESFLTSPLLLTDMDGCLALTPEKPSPELDHLAADCVQNLDDFRVPPSEAELTRRRSVGLSAIQDDLLQRWGYPYVMKEFRFHITLTDRLTNAQMNWVLPMVQMHFASVLDRALEINGLTVLVETGESKNFCVKERFAFVNNMRHVA